MSDTSWADRVFGGFRKTSERLSSNLSGVVGTARLDDATLDNVEDALIVSDLGPAAAARIRARLSDKRFGLNITERELKEAVRQQLLLCAQLLTQLLILKKVARSPPRLIL